MKLRKLLALTMALTLLVCPMQVSAAEGELEEAGTPSSEITSGADVNYVNTTVYKVTLPTTDALEFALDPLGLSTLTEGAVTEGSQGKIATKTPWEITNESSVDITVTSKLYLTDTDTENALTLLEANQAATIDNSAKQLCMLLQEQTGTEGAYVYTDLGAITGTTSGSASVITFDMDKATYEFGGTEGAFTYTLSAGTGSTKKLAIGGACAAEYDWSAYVAETEPKTLTLSAVFSIAEKVAATDTYVMTLNGDGDLAYTFVDVPVESISAVLVDSADKSGAIAKGFITWAEGTFAIDSTKLAEWGLTSTGSHTVAVTFGTEGEAVTKNLTYEVE